MKTGQVFVSHGSDMASFPADRSFVQAVLDAVGRAGMAPVDMRYFAARKDRSADYCRQRVRSCEIYVAVVGFRYGSIVPGAKLSYTELEFEEAGAAGLPRLVFLLEDNADLPSSLVDANRDEVEGFRQRLREAGLVRTFTSATGLELEVFHALTEAIGSGQPLVPRQLPSAVPYFAGRSAELGVLDGLTLEGDDAGGMVVISAIDGMAGVGKTALAVHAAHRLASRFPDGQLFLRLHGHTPGQRPVESADALATLLLAIGVARQQIPAGVEDRAGLWRDRMAARKALLLLDDAASSEQVRPLLPGTAGTLVLITSRHRLTALPEALPVTLDILDAGEAARLFARAAGRSGLFSTDDAVASVVALCGYLPLAISLMAGQLKHHPVWTAADLAAELESAADRLAPMHAENVSVAAAFDLSYRHLPADQQQLFRRLGLHPGTDIDDFAAAALDGTGLAATHRLMDNLFGYHLIDEPARGRYRFHDLVRAHARTLAAADTPAEHDAAVDRLLDYYLHTARAADHHLARRTPVGVPAVLGIPPACSPDLPTREEAATWMDTERLNLQAAVGYATQHDRPGHAIAIPAAMNGFLRTQGHWDQALTLHNTALNTARHTGDRLAEAGALTDLGGMQQLTGNYLAAGASFTRALKLYRDLGNRLGEAGALDGLGAVQYLPGNYPAANASLTRALELFGDNGDRLGEAGSLHRLGVVQRLTANYQAAEASQERALKLYRDLGDQVGEAGVLNELGVVQHLTGNYPAAAASQAQALELYRDLRNRLGEASTLENLGIVHYVTGDYPAAAASLAEALDICRDLEDPLGEANVLADMGVLQTLTGNYLAAAADLAGALDLCRGIDSRIAEANARNGLGVLQTLTEDYPAATANLTRALNLYSGVGNRIGEAEVLNNMAELLLASSTPAEARARHQQALKIATSIGSPLEEARALEGIGECQLRDGPPAQGLALLRQAMVIYRRIGSPRAQRVETSLRGYGP